MKTIYMISTLFYPSIGGVENHIFNLSNELCNKNYKVKIINPVINLKGNDIYKISDIEVHKISVGSNEDEKKYLSYKEKSRESLMGFFYGYKRKWYYNKFYKQILEYIENDIASDDSTEFIVHQHDFISSIVLSKKLSKKYKILFTNHTGEFLFLKKLPFSNIIIKFLTNHFEYIIAPSNELAAFNGIRKSDTYKYIPNGVDTQSFSKVSEDEKLKLREELDIPKDKIIVFSPRRWAPTKGIIYLIKSIKELKEKYNENEIIFMFGGDDYKDYPEYRDEILDFIKDNNIKDSIILKGNIEYSKMHKFMKSSDIVVFPSLMEAVSLAALEAMACGKIILATNVGGFPQILEEDVNGFMVDCKSYEQIAEKIYYISKNIENLEYIKSNAVKYVEKDYSWSNICEKTIDIYNICFNKK